MHNLSKPTVTLRLAFEDFSHARELRPRTLENYKWCLRKNFADWLDVDIRQISKDAIEERHRRISQHGKGQANLSMRFMSSLLNFAQLKYQDYAGNPLIQQNPVRRLSEVRAWNREKVRRSYIKPHQIACWFNAVLHLESQTMKDVLVLILMTGLRRREAFTLKWSDLDLEEATLTIREEKAKNHDTLVLPLSDYLLDVLRRRQKDRKNSDIYVFPGKNAGTHIAANSRGYKEVCKQTGIEFTLHDVRRTTACLLDSLDVPRERISQILNHRDKSTTGRYVVHDAERLRKPLQRLTDYILSEADLASAHSSLATSGTRERSEEFRAI